MSIEAMYPSRNQSRAQNPLFARKFRRQRLGAMLFLSALGLGLLLLQIVPIHANAASAEIKSAPAAIMAPTKAPAPVNKAVRQIQIYASVN
jgi:hypothetical protein